MKNFINKLKTMYQKFDVICDKMHDGFFGFFRKHLLIIVTIVLLALSFYIRWCFINYFSGDMGSFLNPWVTFIRENGGFAAIKYYPNLGTFCDYPLAYVNMLALISYLPMEANHAVKLISFVFDYLLAFGAFFLVKQISKSNFAGFLAMTAMLFMPTGIINSSAWAQCDQLYTCCIVWALYFILKGKGNLAMIIVGFSIANKLHTIFFFPALIFLFLNKKVKLRSFLWIPLVMLITFIPGFISGLSFSELFSVYGVQAGRYPNANYNSGSMYSFFKFNITNIDMNWGLAFAFCVVGIALVFLYRYRVKTTPKNTLWVTTFFAFLVPFVMPHMHERYFFFADVMIILYCLTNKRKYHLMFLMQLSSAICYSPFITGHQMFSMLGSDSIIVASLINLYIILTLIKDGVKNLELENKETLEAVL